MQLRKIGLLVAIALAMDLVSAQESEKSSQTNWDAVEASIKGVASYKPKNGLVPDEATAVQVAEAVLQPIYGVKKVVSERPYNAHLSNGTWTVVGSMHSALLGGVAIVKISQADARVIFVIHQQ